MAWGVTAADRVSDLALIQGLVDTEITACQNKIYILPFRVLDLKGTGSYNKAMNIMKVWLLQYALR